MGVQLGPMAAALAPIRQNLPDIAREREILRIVATIPAHDEQDLLDAARDEVLRWARKRAAGELPKEAWDGQSFEALAAGRTTMAALVTAGDSVLWSLRGDDPDKAVPGRIWSAPDRPAFEAGHPTRLVRPSAGTGHKPSSTCHNAHACRARDSPLAARVAYH